MQKICVEQILALIWINLLYWNMYIYKYIHTKIPVEQTQNNMSCLFNLVLYQLL
jgi:hypothetical protein